ITPKKGRAYRPFGSKFFDCRMERETAIEVSIQPDHLRLTIDGDFQFTFLGVRTVPTLQARAITIHRIEGVRMEGSKATLTVRQERGVPQDHPQDIGDRRASFVTASGAAAPETAVLRAASTTS
ncbi:MAG: hypothetical protein PHR35_23295, partial [Kiritimatiellae bacterium]|nr:hypothetical protein [Kiritimatiellia bacterium]